LEDGIGGGNLGHDGCFGRWLPEDALLESAAESLASSRLKVRSLENNPERSQKSR
jgi:hypothetical protein